jgi:FkbM family methyltransferase
MLDFIYMVYAFLFGKKFLIKFNKFLYQLSLRGLGVLNYKNAYLTGENKWLKNYLKNNNCRTVLDVGANIGKYSKEILNIDENINLFAFEPHPKSYAKLKENINSKNFEAFNLGVGNKNETLLLYDYDKDEGSEHASLYKEVIEDLHKGQVVSHDIPVIMLDDFLKEQKVDQVDLLKIDTEGNELNVLLGAKEYLENNKIKAIHFEFNEMNIVSKSCFKNFWDLLPNYQFYRLLPAGKLLEMKNYTPLNCEIFAFQNIIAILKDI